MKKLRWGILGAARIAWKDWKAIYHSGNSLVTAVASRDRRKAEEFVRGCSQRYAFATSPEIFDNYEALLASPLVDAVYIPLPTALRKEWVIRAARAGKHVLSEKPCGIHAGEVRKILAACREQGVQFMDGVMFTHSNRLPVLRQVLDDTERFGQLRRINSNFTFRGSADFLAANIRANGSLEPLGCLGDLGWYNIRLSLWALNWQLPVSATGRILQEHAVPGAASVPVEFSGELTFAGGVSAGFYCSFVANHEQLANFIGTQAQIELPDFVLPFTNEPVGFQIRRYDTPTEGTEWNVHPVLQRVEVGEHGGDASKAQETNMIRNFAAQILGGGGLNEAWPEMTLKTQLVLDACLASARDGSRPVRPG